MMKKVLKVLMGAVIITGLFGNNNKDTNNNTGNNVLKSGKIIDIEYSEDSESEFWKESLDKMYFEIDGQIYLYYDFAEDMSIGDDVLVTINTRGTENLKDDVIRDYKYWRPDLESENDYFNVIENGKVERD